MSSEPLATAHETWERNWTAPEQQGRWLKPEPAVEALAPLLRERGFERVLDVGCGLGRHAQFLASQGFQCVGSDASEAGLDYARAQAAAAGLHVEYRAAPFYELPFADSAFDAIVAWNVIYHGDRDLAQRAVDEFRRVLAPTGLYLGTMLSTRNRGYGVGREIRPGTFVVDDATDDKIHPHLYLSAPEVVALHRGFELVELRDVEQAPGANHWQFLFERLR